MRLAAAAAAIAFVSTAGTAAAQDGWSFALSLYGWLPAVATTIDTPVGEVSADHSQSDVITSLQFAFMGFAEARKDRWSLVGDVIYADLDFTDGTIGRGFLYDRAKLDSRMTLLSGYALYRAVDDPKATLDVGLGARAYFVDLGLNLRGNLARDRKFDGDQNWADPLVAARLIAPFGEKWSGTLFGDIGGTSSDDRTWQALAVASYHFNERWSASAGYRYLRIEKDIGGLDTTMDLYGPLVGATLRF